MNSFRLCLLAFVFLAMLVSPVLATVAPSETHFLGANWGVNSSPHNLSRLNNNPAAIQAYNSITDPNSTRICVFCHAPHSTSPDTPLWNRPEPGLMGQFPLYNAAIVQIRDNFQAEAQYNAAVNYPNGASKMCLSCHDGATAIGTMANDVVIPMEGGADFITNSAMIFDNNSLGDTHPISFVYNASVDFLLGGSYNAVTPYLDRLERMQCTTCHDPHYDSDMIDGARRPGGSTYELPFWRGARTGGVESTDYDAICNGCHNSVPVGAPHAM